MFFTSEEQLIQLRIENGQLTIVVEISFIKLISLIDFFASNTIASFLYKVLI